MKPSRFLPALALSSLLMTSCKADRPEIEGGRSSQLADIAIGSLSKPNWTRFELKLERLRPTTEIIERNYPKVDGKDFNDSSVQVLHGDYKILLSYRDAQGKLLYESCPEEKTKEHVINVPRYPVEIKVCTEGGELPVELVKPKEADVSIKPVVVPPKPSTTPAPPTTPAPAPGPAPAAAPT